MSIRDYDELNPNKLEIGDVGYIPIQLLKPSQPDDKKYSLSKSPIEICSDKENIIVIHGNHRYYQEIKESNKKILAVVKKNPYQF